MRWRSASASSHRGFAMTPREIVDWTLRESGRGTLDELIADDFKDVQPDFRTAHYLDGFGYRDGKFRFKPDWPKVPNAHDGLKGPYEQMPALPDQWNVIEAADESHPFRLATSPARNFLNSSFTETPTSLKKEGGPSLMLHPDDAARLGIAAGAGDRRRQPARQRASGGGPVRGRPAAASSSPNRSGPMPPTGMAAASTRSPGPIRLRPSAAPPSTTTRSGSGKRDFAKS